MMHFNSEEEYQKRKQDHALSMIGALMQSIDEAETELQKIEKLDELSKTIKENFPKLTEEIETVKNKLEAYKDILIDKIADDISQVKHEVIETIQTDKNILISEIHETRQSLIETKRTFQQSLENKVSDIHIKLEEFKQALETEAQKPDVQPTDIQPLEKKVEAFHIQYEEKIETLKTLYEDLRKLIEEGKKQKIVGGGTNYFYENGVDKGFGRFFNFIGATVAQNGSRVDITIDTPDLTPYLTTADAATTYEPLKGVDDNYVTDAEKTVIGNTSGTNTGDQDLTPYFHKTNDDSDDITQGTANTFIKKVGTAYVGGDQTGNARGTNALDIQSTRSADTQVASGNNAVAYGANNTASAYFNPLALGTSNTVTSHYGAGVGYNNSVSGNYNNVAFGAANTTSGQDENTASGYANTASGMRSTALGSTNTASGYYATTIGYSNSASGYYNQGASAIGAFNNASGMSSSAFGSSNTASGYKSTAIGAQTSASGYYSTASGYFSTATADGAVSIGYLNSASGLYSAAIGFNNSAAQQGATAIGYQNLADGQNATALGYSADAGGENAIAAGWNADASAQYAAALGSQTIASGIRSTAVGYNTTASGYASFAAGYVNVAKGARSSAVGYSNSTGGDEAVVVGTRLRNFIETSTQIGSDTNYAIMSDAGFGVRTITPQEDLHVSGNALIADHASLGSEKVTNGGFDTDTAWTKGTGWTITSGTARKTINGTGTLSQNISAVAGELYYLTFQLQQFSAGTIQVSLGGVTIDPIPFGMQSSGTFQNFAMTILATSTGNLIFTPSNDARVYIENVSCKRIEGGDTQTYSLSFREKQADPADPGEGKSVMWLSDGTGLGDDGDIMVKITAGGVTKSATLVDFSTL